MPKNKNRPKIKLTLEPVSFQEAEEYFRDKVALTPEEFASLGKEYKTKAFTVADIAALDIINDIMGEAQKAIKEGLTVQQFRKNVNEIMERKGWEGVTPYRADNIFRNNIQTAYNIGRFRQMTDPNIMEARPYWMYDAVNDRRTRPTHMAMDGMVVPADDPFWNTWYPPNGYRCRCQVRNLSERDMQRTGRQVTKEVPKMVEPPGQLARPLIPDKGFDYNPALKAWEPDMSKYPDVLRKAFKKKRAS